MSIFNLGMVKIFMKEIFLDVGLMFARFFVDVKVFCLYVVVCNYGGLSCIVVMSVVVYKVNVVGKLIDSFYLILFNKNVVVTVVSVASICWFVV